MPVRFTDVLTTSTAVANYLGDSAITMSHLRRALEVLEGQTAAEDLGRMVSPLIPRRDPAAEPEVREFAQRWFALLGSDVTAELDGNLLAQFRHELTADETRAG